MAIRAKVASKVASFLALAILNDNAYDDVTLFVGGTPKIRKTTEDRYNYDTGGYTEREVLDSRGHKDAISMCPKGFQKATGITMKPGESKYFTITLKPAKAPAPVARKKVAKRKK